MEPTTTPPPVSAPPPAPTGIFGTSLPVTATSVVALLLFFLPFAEIRCTSGSGNGMISSEGMAFSNTGLGIAIGQQWKPAFAGFGNNDMGSGNTKTEANIFGLIAIIAAAATAVFSFLKQRWALRGMLFTAGLSAAALIGLFIDLKNKVKDSGATGMKGGGGDDEFGFMKDVGVELVFTAWYYIAIVLLIAIIWLVSKRIKSLGGNEFPR